MNNNILFYKDLIVDILVDNNLDHHILDLDELPYPLELFENGKVKLNIDEFLLNKKKKIDYFREQSKKFIALDLQRLWDENM